MRIARPGMVSALLVLILSLSAVPVAYSFVTGQCKTLVLGQGGSLTNGFNSPESVAVDQRGNVWVADTVDNRVLEFSPPLSSHMNANSAIGQKDLVSRSPTTTQNGLNTPTSVVFDVSGNMWVADKANGRALEFTPPFFTGENASVVVGAPNFTSASSALPSANRLIAPTGIAFDPGGHMWVVDDSANRVVEFVPPFTNGMSASVVVGQKDFTSFGGGTSQSSLLGPIGVAFDTFGDLFVTDTQNNRVLEFASASSLPASSTAPPATVVLGQSSFGATGSSLTQAGFFLPRGIAFSSGTFLWVVDSGNGRVLEFKPPFSTGEAASFVLGANNFTVRGYPGLQANQSAAFDGAWGMAVDPTVGDLWVTEVSGGVVGRFDHNGTSCAAAFTTISTTSSSSAGPPTTTSSLTSSSSTGGGGGGIPEFPYQFLLGTVFTILIVSSYLLITRRRQVPRIRLTSA